MYEEEDFFTLSEQIKNLEIKFKSEMKSELNKEILIELKKLDELLADVWHKNEIETEDDYYINLDPIYKEFSENILQALKKLNREFEKHIDRNILKGALRKTGEMNIEERKALNEKISGNIE